MPKITYSKTKIFQKMNRKLTNLIFVLLASMMAFLASCGDSNSNKDAEKDAIDDIFNNAGTEDIPGDNLTFYLIPSPKDMFDFTNDANLPYSVEVLNPVENVDKYLDTKTQELGFGIYSADLAYTAAFTKTKDAIKYLGVVRELSDKIGISSVFDESLVGRFENVEENKDSLMSVTNDTYFDIVKHLELNDRKSSLALISAGGWLESLYIVVNLVKEYKENDKTIQLIADQKNIFENLILYLEQNKNDENIKKIIEDLKPIQVIYDELEEVDIENNNGSVTKTGQIVIGGARKIVIKKEQYDRLKQTITTVRNKLTGNNV